MIRRIYREEEGDEINISPLIDMVFILLIFFVVTSTFTRETGVKVNRPRASSVKQLKKKNIQIAVTSDGTIHIHEKQVNLEHLSIILKNLIQESPDSDAVIISDKEAKVDTVVRVIDICNNSGIKKVSIGAMQK